MPKNGEITGIKTIASISGENQNNPSAPGFRLDTCHTDFFFLLSFFSPAAVLCRVRKLVTTMAMAMAMEMAMAMAMAVINNRSRSQDCGSKGEKKTEEETYL